MPLNKAQLMEVPGGPGITGAVKSGTGITISGDGTISVNPATNVTQLIAGTNITLNPANGFGAVTITAGGGGGGSITGVTAGTGLSGGGTSGNVTLSNSGVTGLTAGSNITLSGGTGQITISATGGGGAFLPLAGGTLTGGLLGTTSSFSSTCTAISHELASSRGNLSYVPSSTAGPATQVTAGPGLAAVLASNTGAATVAATAAGICVMSSGSGGSFMALNASNSASIQLSGGGGVTGGISYRGGLQTVGYQWQSPNLIVFIENTNAGTVFVTASDTILKENITPVLSSFGLASINSLNPVSFNYLPGSIFNSTDTQYGFIANEIEVYFPEAYVETEDGDENIQKSYNNNVIITSLVKSVQELSVIVNQLQTDFDAYVLAHP